MSPRASKTTMAVCQSQTSSKCLCGLYCLMLRGQSTLSIVFFSLLPAPTIFFVMLLRFLLKIKLNFPNSFVLIQATNYREMRNDLQHQGIF